MKKKLAIFAERLYGGGVEKILQIILSHFDYLRYDVTLYASREEDMPEGLYPASLKRKYYFNSGTGLLAKIENKIKLFVYYHCKPSAFYKLFIREKFEVGIAFIEGYATRILSGAPEQTRKISWIHIELDNFHWTSVAYPDFDQEMQAYGKMDKVVCVSEEVKRQADKLFSINAKSFVVHNPIDRDCIIKQSLAPLPQDLTSRNHTIRIISLGSLTRRKGHIRLLHAINRLNKEGFDLEVWIGGSGEEETHLQGYVREEGMEGNVRLLGFLHNPYPYIAAADIYVCSSFAEGYNTAITEALVLGKPVVSTECSGVKEQLGKNNEWGICVGNSEEGLYSGIRKMLDKPTLEYFRKQAAIRGRDFSLEYSMRKIFDLIEA